MKKILIIFLLSFFSINISFACKYKQENKNVYNFKQNCFENVSKLNLPDYNKIDNCGYSTYKISSPERIETFIRDNQILPFKLFKYSGEKINFSLKNLEGNIDFLKDDNYKTFLTYDEQKITKPIIINFDNIQKANSFIFNFSYKAIYREAQVEISTDSKKYFYVPLNNLNKYDIKSLKIYFNSNVLHITPPEKIQIQELNFVSKNYVYLLKNDGGNEVKIYSKNICPNYYPDLSNNTGNYNLNKNTKEFLINFEKNINFNPNKIEDKDGDRIIDSEDNCPTIYNPKQKDKNGNGVGDACSDVDYDGILGYKDNCPYIYNPNQKDVNNNKIGDKCEFDKDKDGIFDSKDNCITTPNKYQEDNDKDGIGDVCDNCKYYNPRQIDKNGDGVGDVCEQKEKYLKDHDKDKDGIIDYEDNCPNIPNKLQLDSDNDGVGNACDNCPSIDNANQVDKDKNGTGDMCEDVDKDSIIGYKDNCPYIANPKQEDRDNNGIGNLCEDEDSDNIVHSKDNCPFDYNPDQADVDKDGIGNVCDKSDDRLIESNKNIFIALLVLVVILFGFGIFQMVKKLK